MIRLKAILLLLVAYVAVLATMTGIPWGDLPNHLTRVTIIGELLFSPTSYYHAHYSFQWMFAPYVLWDLLAAGTSRLLPVEANGVLWTLLTFLSVVSGGWYLAKVRLQSDADRQALTAFSILMATGFFFAWGFFGFQLSLGLCLFAVAFGYRLREGGSRLSAGVIWPVYIVLILACYLTHLGGFFGLCIVLGTAAVARVIRRRDQLAWEAATLAPAVLLGLWYVRSRAAYSAVGLTDEIVFRSPLKKLLALSSPWLRFPVLWEWPLLLGLGIGIALLFMKAVPALKSRAHDAFVNDLFFPVAALTSAYLILPQGGFQGWDVDVRMLPFLGYFLVLWLLAVGRTLQPASNSEGGFLTAGPVLLATCWVSLLVLLIQIWPYNVEARKYWDALKQIPEHQVVLAVSTHPYLGRLLPMHHQGNLYAAFKEGIAPDIYSSENGPFPFFRPLEKYAPPPNLWYVRDLPTPAWDSIASKFDYLVVSKPFDPARLPRPVPPIFMENDVVVVYKLNGTGANAAR